MLEQDNHQYEKAILVGLVTGQQDAIKLEEYLDELEFLAHTAGATVLRRFTQKLPHPSARTFVGSGKLEEIKAFVEMHDVGTIIFDDELTPAQQRNLERETGSKIVDRTYLILDIFAQRAQTSYAVTQVELAQYEYLLPRLVGLWTHLERQKGGIGMRGPGETEIETDRRIVRDRITLLRKKLAQIDKQMATQRGNRGALVRVALAGYTNVGKSTLLNTIAKTEVFAENKLFATLDTTVRKVVIGNMPFLLTDTVGFIRKLPTQLVESFKSTLDEVRESDLILHVVDISHESYEDHIESVKKILEEIGAADKPVVMVFNKIDAYNDDELPEGEQNNLTSFKKSYLEKMGDRAVFISAEHKTNMDEFRKVVYEEVRKIHVSRFPYNAFLYPDIEEVDFTS